MNIHQKIIAACSPIVDGNIWPVQKPLEEDPDEFIVFNSELDQAAEWGDDDDLEWIQSYQVHWYHRGVVDYLSRRKQIRAALKQQGLTVPEISFVRYDADSTKAADTGWTHLCFNCNDVEED